MTTVLEDADEGSSRASCVFMARSYTGQVLVRNPSAKSVHISASYARFSQKTGHVLVRTPGTRKPGFQPQKRAMSGGLKLRDHGRHKILMVQPTRHSAGTHGDALAQSMT